MPPRQKITDDQVVEALRRTLVNAHGQDWSVYAVTPRDILSLNRRRGGLGVTAATLARRLKLLVKVGRVKAGAPGYYAWPAE